MTTTWTQSVLRMTANRRQVADAMTLADVYAALLVEHPTLGLEEFKAGMVSLYEARQIRLEDYTRAWADVIDETTAIKHGYDEARGYGLKWYVRGI